MAPHSPAQFLHLKEHHQYSHFLRANLQPPEALGAQVFWQPTALFTDDLSRKQQSAV